MKILYSFLLTVLLTSMCSAQENDSTISTDLLRTPNSPGFSILGINPTDFDKPTDVTNFWINIQKATNDFATLPKNYSIELAPAWIFWPKTSKTWTDFKSNKFSDNFFQSFTVSLAIKSKSEEDSLKKTSIGSGLKFSIFRGKIDEEYKDYREKMDSIRKILANISDESSYTIWDIYAGDTTLQLYYKSEEAATDSVKQLIKIREDLLLNEFQKNKESIKNLTTLSEKIKDIASRLKLKRIGYKWDVALGVALKTANEEFDSLKVSKYGVWTTFGHEWSSGWSSFLMIRYIKNIDKIVVVDSTNSAIKSFVNLDIGASINFEDFLGFNISGNGIYRYEKINNIKDKWKLTFNLSYEFDKNKALTFTFGRDFEGNTTKGGNLIAALNLLLGFGSKRPF